MNGLRIIMGLFHSSEIQLFHTICLKCTWYQTNKDYKDELVDVLCFLNMTSAVAHTVLLISDYLQSTFHKFVFSHVLLLTRTSNSYNVLFIQNHFRINISSKCEILKIHKTQRKICNSYKKVFIRTSENFICFQHYKALKKYSHQMSLRRFGR